MTIRLGAVPRTLPATSVETVQGPIWQARPDAFLIEIEGVARYLVADGKDILIEPLGSDADDVAAFLLGAAFAPLLQQRGVVTLHAAAVAWQAGAVLLLGRAVVGKSSLAAALVARGHALLADDIAGVVLDADSRPQVLPAFPYQRLWGQTLDRMDWRGQADEPTKALKKVRSNLEKYWRRTERYCAEPRPVLAAIRLAVSSIHDIAIESLPSSDAFWAFDESTYRKGAMDAMGGTAAHFPTVTKMAQDVPLLQATRPRHQFLLEELAARVDTHLLAMTPRAGGGRHEADVLPPARRLVRRAAVASRVRSSTASTTPAVAWLVSYPKSGNTWLRAVLTNYLREDDAPASINALLGKGASVREAFDEFLGAESSDMTATEVERHLAQFREWLPESRWAAQHPEFVGAPFIAKTHDAYRVAHGPARFPPTGVAVYLLRNPLDVAVSYAHHSNLSIDRMIAWMNREDSSESRTPEGAFQRFPELLDTWSGHVSSWTEQTDIPVHVARYEDLLADPHAGFAAIVRFLGLGEDPARLRQAVERSGFERLQAQEAEFGFVDKQPTAHSFFRRGVAGSWMGALAPEQVLALVEAHGDAMARFGYLKEAQFGLG